jgi:hypothetical protein
MTTDSQNIVEGSKNPVLCSSGAVKVEFGPMSRVKRVAWSGTKSGNSFDGTELPVRMETGVPLADLESGG